MAKKLVDEGEVLEADFQTIPFVVKDGDETHKVYLKELSGAERDKYLTDFAKRSKKDASGKPVGIQEFDGIQSMLLKRCLFYQEDNTLVEEKLIQRWPSRIQSMLFDKAIQLSGLDREGVETAKND